VGEGGSEVNMLDMAKYCSLCAWLDIWRSRMGM